MPCVNPKGEIFAEHRSGYGLMEQPLCQDLKVTVAMPVFNGGRYFELALQSALAQNYTNLEIVIVNDGSTDGGETAAIAEKYAARYSHIKYIHQENRGVGGALNTVLSEMTGDVFTWLSHDDLFEPHKTARQVEFFKRLDNPNAMLFSDWYVIGPDGELLNELRYDHEELIRKPRLALLGGKINGVTVFIPRHLLLEAGGFDEKFRFVQDYDLWNRLIAKYDFFHMPESLIRYRSHPNQDSHKPGNISECDNLWMRIIDDRGEAERVHLFGSSYRFYRFMASRFRPTPFMKTTAYAEKKASEALQNVLVSVVIPVDTAGPNFSETIESLRAQVAANLEIIVVDTSLEGISIASRRGENLKVVRSPGARFWRAVNKGISYCLGDYVSFARPGARFSPNKTWKQVTTMQIEGRPISYSSYSIAEDNRAEGRKRAAVQVRPDLLSAHLGKSNFRLETVMVHISEILGGLQLPAWMDDDLFLALEGRSAPLFIDECLVAVTPSYQR